MKFIFAVIILFCVTFEVSAQKYCGVNGTTLQYEKNSKFVKFNGQSYEIDLEIGWNMKTIYLKEDNSKNKPFKIVLRGETAIVYINGKSGVTHQIYLNKC